MLLSVRSFYAVCVSVVLFPTARQLTAQAATGTQAPTAAQSSAAAPSSTSAPSSAGAPATKPVKAGKQQVVAAPPPKPVPAAKPTVSPTTPSSATAGQIISISGTNFGTAQGTVEFGSTPGAVAVDDWTPTSIKVAVPDVTAGSANIVVALADGTKSDAFNFTVTPNITGVKPFPATPGGTATIAGTGFGTDKGSIKFGSLPASDATNWGPTSITVTVPALPPDAPADVIVTAGGQNSAPYCVVTCPIIKDVSPSRAEPDDTVTITGTNFGSSGTVTFGSMKATVAPDDWKPTSVKVTMPDVVAGPADVVVSADIVVSAGTENSKPFPFTANSPTIRFKVTPQVIQPANGKLPASVNLMISEQNCDGKNGVDLLNGANAPYSIKVTGSGIVPSSTSKPSKCTITSALTIDPNAPAMPYKVILYDKAGSPVGSADMSVLDASAGPIPPGIQPQVDVFWEVMSQNNCDDNFGARISQTEYCVQLKIGNNTGYPLQIAGIGFSNKLDKLLGQDMGPVITANSSYVSTRAVLLEQNVTLGRNIAYNVLQGTGILMAAFTPFFGTKAHPNGRANWTTWSAIVTGPVLSAFNLVAPNPVITQLNNLDDQSFRDSRIIPNNTQVQTVVFFEKQALTNQLRDLALRLGVDRQREQQSDPYPDSSTNPQPIYESKCSSSLDDSRQQLCKDLQQAIKNSRNRANFPKHWQVKGSFSPLLVKLALGKVVVVGDEIDYRQRIQIQSSATSAASPSPLSAKPGSLSFSSQNGVTSGAGQSMTLTNTGTSPLDNIGPKITGGTAASDFTLPPVATNSCPTSLAGGSSCTVSVAYNPSTKAGAVEPRTASLEVSFGASPTPVPIELSGAASNTVYFSTTALALGTATNANPSTAKLTITNFESTSMTFTDKSGFPVTGTNYKDFPISNGCGGTLAVNSSCTVTISFKPNTVSPPVAARTATMTVNYQISGAASSQTITLSGTAQ